MSEYSVTPESSETSKNTAETDPVKLEQFMQQLKSEQNLLFGFLAGFGASIIAAILWGIITYLTGFQIGFMAIGVGFLVGYAIRYAGCGLSPVFGVVGAVFSLLGCLLGNVIMALIIAFEVKDATFSMVLSALIASPGIILTIMKLTFSPVDLIFYAIAGYEGYRFSMRRISSEELAYLQKSQG